MQKPEMLYPRIVERIVTEGADGYSAVVIAEEAGGIRRFHTGSAVSAEGAQIALEQLSRDAFLITGRLDNPS